MALTCNKLDWFLWAQPAAVDQKQEGAGFAEHSIQILLLQLSEQRQRRRRSRLGLSSGRIPTEQSVHQLLRFVQRQTERDSIDEQNLL